LIYVQDISKYNELEYIVADAFLKIGAIDGFIHSAGIELTMPLISMNHNYYEKLFAINVISGFELARIVSKRKFINPAGASFVFIASVMSDFGQAGKIGYCSSKGALVAGARAMSLELISKKIRVNCISPAVISTEMSKKLLDTLSSEAQNEIIRMHPTGIGQSLDIANGCVFLLSDAAKWVTGTNLIIDGGYTAR